MDPPESFDAPSVEPAWLNLPFDRIGLVLGPLLLIGWLNLVDPGGLTVEAHRLAGVLLLTIVWWLTEPIPIPATGLFAIVLAMLLGAVRVDPANPFKASAIVLASFADPSVFFMLGGLVIGRGIAKHGLDRRLALLILCSRWAGRSPATVLAATGLGVMSISMWISNTAATAMMYPVAVGIISVLAAGGGEGTKNFTRSGYASSLLLMTAFASSVGGISTPIGTATNVVALGFFRRPDYFGQPVDFLRWSMAGVPLMLVIFTCLYFWLRLQARTDGLDMPALRGYLRGEYDKLGPWRRGELNTLGVFLVVVCLWVAPGLLDTTGELLAGKGELCSWLSSQAKVAAKWMHTYCPEEIAALLALVLLFLVPVDWRKREFSLEAVDLCRIDWGIILLFGSGLALGNLMFQTGLAEKVGKDLFAAIGTNDVPTITAVSVVAGILLSEITGNAAAAATLLPVILPICREAEVDPLMPLMGVWDPLESTCRHASLSIL